MRCSSYNENLCPHVLDYNMKSLDEKLVQNNPTLLYHSSPSDCENLSFYKISNSHNNINTITYDKNINNKHSNLNLNKSSNGRHYSKNRIVDDFKVGHNKILIEHPSWRISKISKIPYDCFNVEKAHKNAKLKTSLAIQDYHQVYNQPEMSSNESIPNYSSSIHFFNEDLQGLNKKFEREEILNPSPGNANINKEISNDIDNYYMINRQKNEYSSEKLSLNEISQNHKQEDNKNEEESKTLYKKRNLVKIFGKNNVSVIQKYSQN